jgi:hypothetical protein
MKYNKNMEKRLSYSSRMMIRKTGRKGTGYELLLPDV